MSRFVISGNAQRIIESLFRPDEQGHLAFGFAGRSKSPASRSDVLTGGVEIVDYVMEGFVKYRVRAQETADGVQIDVEKLGTNRDEYVDWCVKHCIESSGFTVVLQASSTEVP